MLRLDATMLPPSIIDELKHVFGNHEGPSEVVLALATTAGEKTLRFGPDFKVAPTPSLRAELARIVGPEAVGASAATPV